MSVSGNPRHVEFPRDQWGFTTALRKYGLMVAGAIRGDEKKLQLYIQTLGILAQHAQARFPDDQAAKAAKLAAQDRATAEAVAPVKAPVQEPAANPAAE